MISEVVQYFRVSNIPKFQAHPACQQIFAHSQRDHNPWLCKGPKLEQRTLGVGEQEKHRVF